MVYILYAPLFSAKLDVFFFRETAVAVYTPKNGYLLRQTQKFKAKPTHTDDKERVAAHKDISLQISFSVMCDEVLFTPTSLLLQLLLCSGNVMCAMYMTLLLDDKKCAVYSSHSNTQRIAQHRDVEVIERRRTSVPLDVHSTTESLSMK